MLKLYIIIQPSLPIPVGGRSVFQREYSKLVFPDDPVYGDLEFGGQIDVISYVAPDHGALSKVNWKSEYGLLRPVLTDIKTSARDLPQFRGIVAFDKQLRIYSWLTGIRDAALLWFKKSGHALSKGSSITLLEDVRDLKAGKEAVIAQVTDEGVWLVYNDFMLEEMNKEQGRKEDGSLDQTKAAKAKKASWLYANGILVQKNQITKQRLQFDVGFVSVESAEDAGRIAADQIIRICRAWETKKYNNTFGIRYPNDDITDPYFRAFVLNDTVFKDENFTQKEEEDLFEEEPEAGE